MAIDRFEQKILLEYIIKVLKKSAMTRIRLAYIANLDFLDNNSLNEFFLGDKKRKMSLNEDIDKNYVISLLEKLLKKYQKTRESSIQKCINCFSELYSFEENTKQVLAYCIRISSSSTFNDFNNEFLNENKRFYRSHLRLITLFDFNTSKLSKIINKLLKQKILDKETYKLNTNFIDLFNNSDILTGNDIIQYILGKKVKSSLKWSDFNHHKQDREILLKLLKNAIEVRQKGVNILFYGKIGTGKTELAKLIAQKAKVDMLFVDNKDADCSEFSRLERLNDLHTKIFLPINKKFCVLFDEAEDVFNNQYFSSSRTSKSYINNLLEETPSPIFWTTNNIKDVDKAFLRRMTYVIKFDDLDNNTKLNIWKKEFKKQGLHINDVKKIEKINKNYEVSPSLISNAVTVSKLIGNENIIEHSLETMTELLNNGCKVQKSDNLIDLDMYRLEFVNCKNDIEFLTKQIIASGNLNFSLCLYGESGTGKSAYARYLANRLGLKVILKRASDLVSCYVGETEQNIAKAFKEARDKKTMLIFDEADSFLSSRTNAQRNWEVSQVNEMLTQMESYDYPFVCTTNLVDKLDEASLRRFMFKLKFDFLNESQIDKAFKHFFKQKATDEILKIKGLTTSDMNNVMKKTEFLNIKEIKDIAKMLKEEVSIKKTDELKASVGF